MGGAGLGGAGDVGRGELSPDTRGGEDPSLGERGDDFGGGPGVGRDTDKYGETRGMSGQQRGRSSRGQTGKGGRGGNRGGSGRGGGGGGRSGSSGSNIVPVVREVPPELVDTDFLSDEMPRPTDVYSGEDDIIPINDPGPDVGPDTEGPTGGGPGDDEPPEPPDVIQPPVVDTGPSDEEKKRLAMLAEQRRRRSLLTPYEDASVMRPTLLGGNVSPIIY